VVSAILCTIKSLETGLKSTDYRLPTTGVPPVANFENHSRPVSQGNSITQPSLDSVTQQPGSLITADVNTSRTQRQPLIVSNSYIAGHASTPGRSFASLFSG